MFNKNIEQLNKFSTFYWVAQIYVTHSKMHSLMGISDRQFQEKQTGDFYFIIAVDFLFSSSTNYASSDCSLISHLACWTFNFVWEYLIHVTC